MNRPWALTLVGCATLVIAVDQASKGWVRRELGPDASRNSIDVIGQWFRLRYVENRGFAFGIGSDRPNFALLLALIGGAAIVMIMFRISATQNVLNGVAMGMIIGGAVGNLFDRVRQGFVVDFLDAGRWPVFNVADSALTIGLVLLLISTIQDKPAGDHVDMPVASK